MSRTIRIIKTGVTQTSTTMGEKQGRPWVRGVVDFTEDESRRAYELSRQVDANTPAAAFGIVNGLPDEAAAKLSPGDDITADTVVVNLRAETYRDANGDECSSIGARIRVEGACSRTSAPVATCDW